MRSYAQAKAFAEHERVHPMRNWTFLCQSFARQCVGSPAFGTSALRAWNATPAKWKRTQGPPPPGSIAYYGTKGAGHAVFVVENGMVYSTDIKRKGKIDKVPWDVFPRVWGLKYRGYILRTPAGSVLPVKSV